MPWLHLSTDLPWCVQAKEKALKEAQKKLADAVKALAKANKDAADVAAKATKAASDKTKLFMGECRWLVPVLEALPPAGVPNFTVTCLHCSHWQSLTELWAASTPPPAGSLTRRHTRS